MGSAARLFGRNRRQWIPAFAGVMLGLFCGITSTAQTELSQEGIEPEKTSESSRIDGIRNVTTTSINIAGNALGATTNAVSGFVNRERIVSILKTTNEAARPVLKSTHYRTAQLRISYAQRQFKQGRYRWALLFFEQAMRAGWPNRSDHLETLWEFEKRSKKSRIEKSIVLVQSTQNSAASTAISQFIARKSAGTDEIAKTFKEMTTLGLEILELDAELSRLEILSETGEGSVIATAKVETRSKLEELEEYRDTLRKKLCKQYRDVCELMEPRPVKLAELQRSLEADEALIIVDTVPFEGGDDYLWAVTKDAATWLQIEPEGTDVDNLIRAVRGYLQNPRAEFGTAKQRETHALYQATLGQVEDLIADKSHLIFVLSGPMTSIPPHALVVEEPSREAAPEFLIDRYAVTIAPSVRSFVSLRTKETLDRAPEPLLAFADPLYDPTGKAEETNAVLAFFENMFTRGGHVDQDQIRSLSRLKETQEEVEAVRKALGGSKKDIYLRRRASEAVLKELSENGELAEHKVIYLATHGSTAKKTSNTSDAAAEPGLAMAGPMEATERDDGFLTASEAALLDLNADWVVLAACNTAAASEAGSIVEGDAEALSGLARSFFYAGARSLLVSHWAVNSETTVDLMTELFERYGDGQTSTGAEALQAAMLEVKGQQKWGHPYYWAPFILVGQPE